MNVACPQCRSHSRVVRTDTTHDYVRRVHECAAGHRFGTLQTYLRLHERLRAKPVQPDGTNA